MISSPSFSFSSFSPSASGSPASRAVAHILRLALLGLTLVACVPGAQSSGSPAARPCTEIGCVSGFSVELERPGPWSTGRYRVEVSGDASGVCEVDLLLACERPTRCSGPAGVVNVVMSGCALGPGQQALSQVSVNGAPGTITVTVMQDDRQLGRGTFFPVYQTSQPNGPGCDPICRTAPPGTLHLAP